MLNAVASYKPGGGWEIGSRFQLASGRPYTPVIGATYNADTGRYIAIRGPARSIRTRTRSRARTTRTAAGGVSRTHCNTAAPLVLSAACPAGGVRFLIVKRP